MATNNTLSVTVNVNTNGEEGLAKIVEALGEIKNDSKGMGGSVSQDFDKIGNSASKNGEKAKRAFSGVKDKIKSVSDSFTGLNGAITGAMGAMGMGSFKSMTVDLTVARMKTKELMTATMGNRQEMESFYAQLKKGTSTSVVQLDMMLNSMNNIKMSTGVTNDQLKSLQPTIQKIGEASLLMGDDTDHATFVMKEAMSGLNGDFQVLKEQFGITADKMKAAGWSGAADDVEGYQKALDKCLEGMGDFDNIMNTTSGKLEKIKKNFRTAGLDIGEKFTPYIDMAADAFLNLTEGGSDTWLSQIVLWTGGAVSGLAMIAPTISPIIDSFSNMSDLIKDVKHGFESVNGFRKDIPEKINNIKSKISDLKSKISGLSISDKIKPISSTVQQSWQSLSSKISSVKTSLATGLNNKVSALKESVLSSWTTLRGRITEAKTALTSYDVKSKLVSAGSAIKSSVLSGWTMLKSKITGAGSALSGYTLKQVAATIAEKARAVATGLSTIATNAATMAQAALNLVMSMNPIGLLVIAIVGLIAVLGYLYFNNEQVRNAVDALGNAVKGTLIAAWNALMGVLNPVVTALKILWQTIQPIINDIGALFGALMGGGDIGGAFNKLLTDIPLVFTKLQAIMPMLVGMVVQAAVTQFNLLVARVSSIWGSIANAIREKITTAKLMALAQVNAIRLGIVLRFNMIIARVQAIFTKIVATIRSKLAGAVSAAKEKALAIYNGIKNKVSQVPDIVKQEFDKIKDRIKTAIDNAKNTAYTAITDLVNTVKRALGIASPGFIQRMFTYEFTSIPGIIQDGGVVAVKAAGNMASNVVSAWNDNMEEFSVPFVESIVPQFNSMTPQMDLTTLATDLGGNVSLLSGGATTNNNNTNTTVVNNYERLVIDLNQLPRNEKEQWWNMLQTISRGA